MKSTTFGGGRALVGALGLSLLMIWASPAVADQAASKNNEGNQLYEQKKYDEALKMYVDAQASRPGAPELHYNIGNVLFRKKEFDKAIEEYAGLRDYLEADSGEVGRSEAGIVYSLPVV